MNIFIVGCGSIGMRHARNVMGLGHRVVLYDQDTAKAERLGKELKEISVKSIEEGLEQKPDGAIICAPTNVHISLSMQIAGTGCPVFIEKPLATDTKMVSQLTEILDAKRVVNAVGCDLRFMESMKKMKELIQTGSVGKILSARVVYGNYLPYWRPGTDYRQGYSAKKALGGGIVLDMIHELDYLVWIFGDAKSVCANAIHISDLETDAEDHADILITFKNGVHANVHVDCLQKPYTRYCEMVGTMGTIRWEFMKNSVKWYAEPDKAWKEWSAPFDSNERYVKEIESFLECIRTGGKTVCDAKQAAKVLALAVAAKESGSNKADIVY